MTPEGIVSAEVKAMLELRQLKRGMDRHGNHRFWFRRINAAPTIVGVGVWAKNKSSGFPDYYCIDQLWGGRGAWIELKRPGAKKRKDQEAQNETIAAFMALGVPVIRTDNAADVEAFLTALDSTYQGDGG